MMTPLRFEQLHQDEWSELEIAIGSVGTQTISKSMSLPPTRGARVALLYRRACEHLALARARAYPAYIVDRLERITEDAHQLIYHRPEVGMGRLRRVLTSEFPASVRAHRRYVAVAQLNALGSRYDDGDPTALAALDRWPPPVVLSTGKAPSSVPPQ